MPLSEHNIRGRRQRLAFAFSAGLGFRSRTPPCASLSSSNEPSRIACRVQYNGAHFHGWESKSGLRTVEAEIANALKAIVGCDVKITAASRTDAGTHAIGQVVHFDVAAKRRMVHARAWLGALNRRLPSDVRVMEAAFASRHFDSRRSAIWRRYRYSILTTAAPSVFLAPLTWHYYQHPLNVSKMHAAAQCIVSSSPRDLSAFRKVGASATHTEIAVRDITVRRVGPGGKIVEIEVCASWFVYGMMRLLTAALVQVGWDGSVQAFEGIVREGKREDVTFSAPPNGLCLMEVGYENHINPFDQRVCATVARDTVEDVSRNWDG